LVDAKGTVMDDADVNDGLEARLQTGQSVELAADVARYLLAGERLAHTEAAARRAETLAPAVGVDEAAPLVTAAWLHDIGYAEQVRDSGFHPLDGARYLRSTGWPMLVCDLVAHHSGARFVAEVRGLAGELAEFTFVEDRVSDALTAADQIAGPGGTPMTVGQRIADMLARHGPDSPSARAHIYRGPYLYAAAGRVVDRLEAVGEDTTGIF
jgi:putative nucleotidyltransferase with HDIG domain